MSSGSRDLAFDFVDDFLSMLIGWNGEVEGTAEWPGFGGSAGVLFLDPVLQRMEGETLEAPEAYLDDDRSTADGMAIHVELTAREVGPFQPKGMHYIVPELRPNTRSVIPEQLAEAAFETSAFQPGCPQFSVPESLPNTGGHVPEQLAHLVHDAPALPSISFGRRANPMKQSRTLRRSILNVAPRAAPRTRSGRWRPQANTASTEMTIFEHQPVGVQTLDADLATMCVEDLQTSLKHPFDPSITPVMYYRAYDKQAPIEAASCGEFPPPSITVPAPNVGTVQQAESVRVLGIHEGRAPDADMQGPIHIISSSSSSNCSFPDTDLRGSMDSISSPATRIFKRAALANPKTSSRPQLSWSPELIHIFESVITDLGGPERATPKGILHLMAIPGLNILQVKSCLQKFRLQLGIPSKVSYRCTRGSDGTPPRVAPPKKPPASHAAINAYSMLKVLYASCMDWSDRLKVQTLHMRHLLALHHSDTKAARHNAMPVLDQQYVARAASMARLQ